MKFWYGVTKYRIVKKSRHELTDNIELNTYSFVEVIHFDYLNMFIKMFPFQERTYDFIILKTYAQY